MERNFYPDEFEQLIRQKADQYKMYPSDHVWKGVYKALHGQKKWYWAGFAVLLLISGFFSGKYLFTTTHPTSSSIASALKAVGAVENLPDIQSSKSSLIKEQDNDTKGLAGINANRYTSSDFNLLNNTTHRREIIQSIARVIPMEDYKNYSSERPITIDENENITSRQVKADASSESILKETSKGENWLEEDAVYQLQPTKQKKFGLLVYFSPTVNYRKLSENAQPAYLQSEVASVPLALSYSGAVDNYVNHKPAFGFELGSNILYKASRTIRLKGGIQFNYLRYNISAFSSRPAKATITLSSNYIADTIVSYSNIGNFSGYAREEIANQYFQISAPVGLEFRILGNERLQFDVAGTIQPTYLLNRNSYLITTDYKSYTHEPSLVRKWNINAGLETYISYNNGSVRWQLGPQFRYQLLSSFVKKYPINEYLMEYGFKIGFSKTIH